ncbi:hypothetical protein [Photobacterium rosenbergii]|uniref:hypothetical protein n=1 Tax=Photobacterium rosenbergii TaxID=294936 RepID=UPI001C998AEB|nr:hypothetical protein [Photobacterium rosenbergii]MBY5944778.1 hypothetical protein [Photobacterium rosenbergii]
MKASKLIIAALIAASSSANAANELISEYNNFVVDYNGTYLTTISKPIDVQFSNHPAKAYTRHYHDMSGGLRFQIDGLQSCDSMPVSGFHNGEPTKQVLKVNGQIVRFERYCVINANSITYQYSPASDRGTEYVVQQLSNADSVTFKGKGVDVTFNTDGFKQAFEEIKGAM